MMKINYNQFSSKQVEQELKREIYKSKYIKILTSTIYYLIIIAAISVLIATLIMPVLKITTSSMNPTFNEGEIVLLVKSKKINTGDIIAFYHGNKILVKRVIALPESWVNIDKEGNVYVDGKIISEPYISEKKLGESDIEFPYQVPSDHYFVLGDNRSDFLDSRNSEIGSISKSDILGKILFRIWPLKKIGPIIN